MMKRKVFLHFGILLAVVLGLNHPARAESLIDGVLNELPLPPVLHNLFQNEEKDEAKKAQEAGNFTEDQIMRLNAGSSVDFFHDMDYGITNRPADAQKALSDFLPGVSEKEAVNHLARGRNNWIVWTFGNDKFWNDLGRATFGGLDFLKTLSTHPNLPAGRSNRWKTLGLVNEPCFKESAAGREDRWGLRLDERIVSKDCPADPFEDANAYPGVKTGARGQTLTWKGKKKLLEVGSFYGYPTGVVGFRLFPNPDFNQAAADRWDPERYYNDPTYFNDPKLVRPYRVGVSCALCHVGPNPSHPPADFNNPTWADLNSNPGAQYFWIDRIFMWNWDKTTANTKYESSRNSFVYQLLHTARPGSLDTSLISSDQINNPRTMNAVYDLPARIAAGVKFNSSELLTGDETRNLQFSSLASDVIPESSPLRTTSQKRGNGQVVVSPRVLKDGSDSVGALGALNRVYVNIGLFGEEWVKHFIPLIGGPLLSPFPIEKAEQNSLYWQANVQQTPDLALFFLASAKPDKLENAPGGKAYLKDFDGPQVSLGKKVFAENCAACHSSKIPDRGYSFFKDSKNPDACRGQNYLKCWNSYWDYTKTSEFKTEMAKMVQQSDFLNNNFLSTDLRIPVSLTDSQLCSPIATNAIKGDIWDNFSSTTYKELPSVGQFTVNFPLDMGNRLTSAQVQVPDGGRGFLRPPSLISVWSTAPFLQNNSLGLFDDRGTVEGRMRSFDDSIMKLLNPDKRSNVFEPKVYGMGTKAVIYKTNFGDELTGDIDVTTQESYFKIPRGYLPGPLYDILKAANVGNPVSKKLFEKKGFEYVTFPAVKETKQKGKEKKRKVASDGWAAIMDPKLMGNDIYIGPIPMGVPVNLLSNLDLSPSNLVRLNLAVIGLSTAVTKIRVENLKGGDALKVFMDIAAPGLVKASKCSDFVVNRGHYFGTKYAPGAKEAGFTGLTDEEKAALVEYIKYF